jgi:hypothetical protein|tara:strand:- start:175 stop:318 length:144 start_codon:yes stop_codon:yes gene_type:complete
MGISEKFPDDPRSSLSGFPVVNTSPFGEASPSWVDQSGLVLWSKKAN